MKERTYPPPVRHIYLFICLLIARIHGIFMWLPAQMISLDRYWWVKCLHGLGPKVKVPLRVARSKAPISPFCVRGANLTSVFDLIYLEIKMHHLIFRELGIDGNDSCYQAVVEKYGGNADKGSCDGKPQHARHCYRRIPSQRSHFCRVSTTTLWRFRLSSADHGTLHLHCINVPYQLSRRWNLTGENSTTRSI